jgi:hypothetical protein
VAALNSTTVLGVTEGDFSNTPPDRLWSLSLSGGPSTKVFDSAEGFTLGAILVDADRGHFIVSDGTSKSSSFLRMFDFSSGTIVATTTIKSNPSHNLPVRGMAWY